MNQDLGKKVKELRLAHNLTQEQVAQTLNVTPGYISNVENNRSSMTLRMLTFYAKLTGVSLDYLAGSIDETYQETALDHELTLQIQKLSPEMKEKLLAILKIVSPNE